MPLAIPPQKHLEAQGPRGLSPLEAGAVDLVFKEKISPSNIELEIVEFIDPEERRAKYINLETNNLDTVAVSAYDGNGKIRISKSAFPHTQALNKNSTDEFVDPTVEEVEKREWTNPFLPGNIHYLSTLIHECTHYWQEKYGRHTDRGKPPFFRFTKERFQQRDTPYLAARQHASAVQIYFLIEWQLHYRKGSNVYLTSRSKNPELNVGPVDRFHEIDYLGGNLKYKNIPHDARIFTNEKARGLRDSYFGWLLVELRYGWKAVCQGKEPFAKVTGG